MQCSESGIDANLGTRHKCLQKGNNKWEHRVKMIVNDLLYGPSLRRGKFKVIADNLELAHIRMMPGNKAQSAVTVYAWPDCSRNGFFIILEQIAIQEGTCAKDLRADWYVCQNSSMALQHTLG